MKNIWRGDMADLNFSACLEALSSVELSPGLRERFTLYEAQALMERARRATGQEREGLMERASTLLGICDASRHAGPTGGLGRGILMTWALWYRIEGRRAEARLVYPYFPRIR